MPSMLTTTLAAATAAAAAAAATLLTKELLQRRRRRERSPPQKVSDLNEMRSRGPHLVPERLRVAFYFDLTAAAGRGCEHAEYLRNCGDVSTALDGLHAYVVGVLPVKSRLAAGKPRKGSIAINSATWLNVNDPKQTFPAVYSPERITPGEHFLLLEPDTRIEGGIFDLSEGSIYIGAGATVELGAYIRGPAHIGKGCVVRHSAYIRGDVVIGADSVVGCELKHMLCLDGCELPHHGYVGDSLLGHRAHLGCGALTANFPLFATSSPSVEIEPGHVVTLGRAKFGAVVGDHSQLGCGAVTEPGCLLGMQTHCYPLCRLPRGLYGPHEVLKNRSDELVERAPYRAKPRTPLWEKM